MNTVATFPDFSAPDHDYHFLNSDQKNGVQEVLKFLMSDEKFLSISGPAGTGKTHLMKFIMKHTLREYKDICKLLGQRYIDFEIALTATTNKAADVLSVVTGFPSRTIHSFMNLKVKDDYDTGKSKITKTKEWKIHSKTIIFVDESSMIDPDLYGYIIAGTDQTCKVIFLGDHCQMAPVYEKISPVYANEKNIIRLTQPMRNAGQPALMALCQQLRDTVETLDFYPIQEVPGVIDYLDDAQAYQFVEDTFKDEDPSCRMLTYSNARAQEYNGYIRALRGHPTAFTEGEVVVNNSAIPVAMGSGSKILQVEAEVVIESVEQTIITLLADKADPTSSFDVYPVTFKEKGGSVGFGIQVPVNYDHVKRLSNAYARQKNWDRYFWLKNTFPDFRQKDACTVYKAQGSTYETVFMDLTNIGTCTAADQLARLLYVAASRATTRLVLYGQLPARLFV